VRFSPDDARIDVQLGAAELPAAANSNATIPAIEIVVRDYGVGIPTPELELVFDEFIQSSRTRTNAGGTGLGLAICKKIMTIQSGTIEACVPDGPGAMLRIRFPLAEPPPSG
jgi:signal transduction histidine kinase